MVELGGERLTRTPREEFVRRLAALWELAGDPTLDRVTRAANQRTKAARGSSTRGTVRMQRISAWRRGDNVPAQFDSLRPVLLTLMDAVPPGAEPELTDLRAWRRLWVECDSWTPELAEGCPYAGLQPYRSADAEWFFGREQVTGELVELVTGTAAAGGGIVVVVGASGAGKSSLLAAGLVPALGSEWTVVSGTPWRIEESDANLEGRRVVAIVDQFEEVFTTALDEPARTDLLGRLRGRADAGETVILGVRADFFARCLETPELVEACVRRAFVLAPMRGDELRTAITEPARRAGLRLEPGLAELIMVELVGLGGTTGSEGAGTLPLLSHVMEAVWQRRAKNQLTIAGYRGAGGVAGSVAHTADAAWAKLNSDEQVAAKDLLLRMVTIGDGTRDTRRRVPRDQLFTGVSHSEDAAAALETLTQARLVTVDGDTAYLAHEVVLDAWPRLREWLDADREGHLIRQRTATDAAEWETSERPSALLYRGSRLDQARRHWRRPPLTGDDSPAVAETAAHESDRAASPRRWGRLIAGDDREIAPGTHAFLVSAIRARRRMIGTQALVAFGVVVLLAAALVGFVNTRVVADQRDEAFFNSVVSEADRLQGSDPTLSAELTALAYRMRPGDAGVGSRLIASQTLPVASSFVDHPGKVAAMAFVGSELLAIAGDDHTVRLRPARGGSGSHELGSPISDPAERIITLLSAGNLLLSAGSDHMVRIRDLSDPVHPKLIRTIDTGDAIVTATLTRDGGRLAVVHAHDVTLWNIADPAAPMALPGRVTSEDQVYGAVFLGDDRDLMVAVNHIQGGFGSTKTGLFAKIDPVHGISRTTPLIQSAGGLAATSLGTGRTMVFADIQGRIAPGGPVSSVVRFARLDDSGAMTPEGTSFTVAAANDLLGMTANKDGTVLATVTVEGVTLWNLADLSQPTVLGTPLAGNSVRCAKSGRGCSAVPTVSGFSPDGRQYVAGLDNGAVQRWSLPGAVLAGQSGQIDSLSNGLSADGRRMVTLSPGTDAHIWDIENPGEVRLLGTIARPDFALAGVSAAAVPAMSHDGHHVALLLHGVFTLVDITDPAKPVEVAHFPGAAGGAFAADRPILATVVALPSPEMVFWDISNPATPVRLGAPVLIPVSQTLLTDGLQLAQTRDGRQVVSLTDKLQVWNVFAQSDSRTPLGSVDATRDVGAVGVAVSPDHRIAAAGWNSGTVRLWSIADPAKITPVGEPLPVSSISVSSVDFGGDGALMATGGTDSTVRLWDTTDPAHPKALGQSIIAPGSTGWRVAFHPRANFLIGAGDNGMLRVWDLNAAHAVDRICGLTRDTIAAQLAAALPGHDLPAVCA
ncbi:WD40 repeat domain-containing protein [Nocardia sp. NPDC056100]|uniref:WD40 repeat domain-containing protein n=1 Tax=Nocardia sp. NPDC056100 TaxID=3345712 RepID=UPI0035D82FDF